ncbi:MAG: hypothetical protein WD029_01570, partial [Microthrixaceae bacterium]
MNNDIAAPTQIPESSMSVPSFATDMMGEPTGVGRFGQFGGMFVPETLVPALHELEEAFRD